ncbi:MAG: magnesium and cobalt transport protein CorA, partial [Zavarzinella sp.]|nr:magnesium and cobalt transport protein CorA [Zavarzinella sp.]
SQQLLTELIHLKRRVIALRKTLILTREVLARLTRGEFALVEPREIAYYRNVFDHLVRYTELIEGAREMVSDLMQTHLAAASNKLNGIMKGLALVSTVILPMSLIASIYGMNFKKMPELDWEYGYPFALGLMVLVAVVCVTVFYRKRWF